MPTKTCAILVALLVTIGVASAYAWFGTTGSGSAQASSGTLAAPSIATATPDAGTVALTWSTVTPPAGGTVTYYVTRDGGAPAGDCPTSSSPAAPTSCTDSGLSAGSHSYAVTAVWRGWTAGSASSAVTLASGAATRLVLSAATTAPTAGMADSLTITAKDADDNTVTGYAGDKRLTFGGAGIAADGTHPTVSDKTGGARDFGAPTTIAFAGGVAAVSGSANGVLRLYRAGAATITVSDGSIGDGGLAVTVSAAAPSTLAFAAQPADAVAGQAISPAVTVEIDDAFGNPTASAASVSLASSAQTLSGTLTRSAVAGAATFDDLSMTTAGSYTLSATSSGLAAATSSHFAITAAATSKLVLTSASVSGPVSSSATLGPLTVQRRDQFGNPTQDAMLAVDLSSDSTGTARFSLTSGGAAVTSVSISPGSSSASVFYGDTKAGAPTITASSSGLTSATQQATITSGAAAKLAFASSAVTGAAAASPTLGPLTVQLQDQFSNPTTAAGTLAVGLSSSSTGTARFALTSAGTAVTSVSIASGSTSASFFYGDTKAGTPTISAANGSVTSGTQQETITGAGATKLAFSSPAVSGQASSSATLGPITVQRQDQFGNATTIGGSITVGLSSNSTGTAKFSLTAGGAAATSVSIAGGSATSAGFFYGDTLAAAPTITATSSGLIAAAQQETIAAAAASAMQFIACSKPTAANTTCSGQPITIGNNSEMTFNMRTVDAFGNPSSPAATIGITFANSDSANFSITAGAPASITSTATQSGQVTLHHDASNPVNTLTAHASSAAIADATLTVKK